ncbi:MAG: MFS transporter [Kiritimatiellae bacterium]|jgi:OPA family glycerol-3-phosphate transporter-like MFS transporter/OPA family sugar phosphate sensor protein UhpC-like MFS transporter|nr:MFS transporter [Kiritimatiellia bacterium]MDD3583934.1 MFS transporter [Kiritimatiellia bacterium]
MTAEQQKKFKYWQRRTIIATMFGYALFYFVRKNLSVAMPALSEDLGISKADLGIFLTLHGLLYGLSRFVNGYWADRMNARIFMTAGLVLSAIMNIAFGCQSLPVLLGVAWVLNGWVQGMGFPPCARLLTHWIPPEQLATKMSFWNTSHSIGASLVVVFCGALVGFGWRWCFFVPAGIALVGAGILWLALRDTPSSVGLPELGEVEARTKQKENTAEFRAFLRKHVFRNPSIWFLSFANFFVYIVRYAVLDWGPTLLKESKGLSIVHASWMVAAFEIAGVVGMVAAGWATDRFFGGRGPRTCAVCMTMTALFVFLFWWLPSPSIWLATALLMGAGFFIYGPQALIGISAANLATKRAAATASGFTGIFGYLSTIVSGWGLGWIAHHRGWDAVLMTMLGAAAIGLLMFICIWREKPHGYET